MKKALVLITLFLYITANAQHISWQLKPTNEYSKIEFFIPSIYKTTSNGKIGFIKDDGTTIAKPIYDKVLPFHDGIALLLKGDEVAGYINSNGMLSVFQKTFKIKDPDLALFSDGLMPVTNNDKVGFIDMSGNIVIPYTYKMAADFSEGYAMVVIGNDCFFIDKNNKKIKPKMEYKVNACASFNNGVGYVMDSDSKLYTINKNGNCSKTSLKMETLQSRMDYKARYIPSGIIESKPPVDKILAPIADNDVDVFSNQGLYGYRTKENVIALPQFDYAGKFYNNYAVVQSNNGAWGILKKYPTSGKYQIHVERSTINAKKNSDVNCSFKLETPSYENPNYMTINVADDMGNIIDVVKSGDSTYSFIQRITKTESKSFSIAVSYENLALWTSEFNYDFELVKDQDTQPDPKPISKDDDIKHKKVVVKPIPESPVEITSVSFNGKITDKNHNIGVSATLYNPNDKSKKVSYSWSNGLSGVIDIPAKSSRTVSTSLKVHKHGNVTTTISVDGRSKSVTKKITIPVSD